MLDLSSPSGRFQEVFSADLADSLKVSFIAVPQSMYPVTLPSPEVLQSSLPPLPRSLMNFSPVLDSWRNRCSGPRILLASWVSLLTFPADSSVVSATFQVVTPAAAA